jgi:hypothetical protein
MTNYETYDIVEEIFDNMEEHPKKYMRVQIKGDKGVIALTGCDGMVLRKALVAEFQNGQLSQLYEFDSEKNDQNNLFFVAKKNKVVAYALGNGDVSYSGHIPCYQSKEADEEDFSTSCSDKLCCGVFVTDYHAYLLIADTKHSKMLYEDILLEEDQPNLLDVFHAFGSYKDNKMSEVKDHVEEE